jgi:rod shape-determining protein MreC
MKHFFTARIRVILIVAVLLAVGLTVVSSLTGFSLPDMVVKGFLTPVRAGVSKLTDRAEQLYSYMFEYESIAAENERLKEQLAQIEDRARQADSIARENERLRNLMELPLTQEGYDVVDSYIISHSSTDWSSTFTINRGSNVGIQEGFCVITANGELVGLVDEVGPNYSVIKSVLDSSLEISATIASSGYNGMVKGGYASGLDGYLRMNYLPSSAVIRNNDQVVTTGSTVYPRDLVLGYVIDAGFDATGVAKFALLEPAANISSLEQIFILTNYNIG